MIAERGVLQITGWGPRAGITYIYIFIHTCIYAYINTYLHTYANVCVFVWWVIDKQIDPPTHIYLDVCIYTKCLEVRRVNIKQRSPVPARPGGGRHKHVSRPGGSAPYSPVNKDRPSLVWVYGNTWWNWHIFPKQCLHLRVLTSVLTN